jgi:glycosyltransferase involved in cell wall biosynthesis
MKVPMLKHRKSTEPASADFEPIRLLQIELDQPFAELSGFVSATSPTYHRARALVRLHTQPIGIVELALPSGGLSAQDCASQIWQALHDEIRDHLKRDGLPEVDRLTEAGLASLAAPQCLEERERLLADAPFVSIVVPTRDRCDRIATCLRLLLALDYPNYEIIVVDNAPSTNATADLIRQSYAASQRISYLREDRAGNSWARNRGLEQASGEIVAFVDDDVTFDSYWLAELVKGFNAAEGVACVTGMILPVEIEGPSQLWIEQYGGFSKGFRRRIFDMEDNRPKDPLFPYTAGALGSGANMAFRTSILRSLGGFDPAIGAGSIAFGGEDLAAFFQVVRSGYKLVYEPAAIVRHLHHRDYARLRRQVYGYGVGLTAYLTKCVFANPRLLVELAARVPCGLFFILSMRSSKNRKKLHDYPRELTYLERQGMLYGPLAYLRGRRQRNRLSKKPTIGVVQPTTPEHPFSAGFRGRLDGES